MKHLLRTMIVLAVWTSSGCGTGGPGGGPGDGDASVEPFSDQDGDSISDLEEGRLFLTDSDEDGTPDYLDEDSDDDGIPDAIEAGDDDLMTPPEDADDDGLPNYIDADSDGNGRRDLLEGTDDTDGDGREDFRDLDDDDDRVPDALELIDPDIPTDFDRDGLADYQDPDSDGDSILDGDERSGRGDAADTDGDGTPDWRDDDSDGDGLSDATEAGDTDARTAPRDTDEDSIPDFRDFDSDDDGLADSREVELGTDPIAGDSDGDGVGDLVEVSACPTMDESCAGDATNPDTSPRARGDFVFVVPHDEAPMPARDTLIFSTDIRFADVYFLIDATGSMGAVIANVQDGLTRPGTGIIDRVREEIPGASFGVGAFKDYGIRPYGAESDFAYRHLRDISADETASQAAVNGLSAYGGGDGPESYGPALWSALTGYGLAGNATGSGPLAARTGCPDDTFGYPCFRDAAVPIVVIITDVHMHNAPAALRPYDNTIIGGHTPIYPEVVTAMRNTRARVVGISIGPSARPNLAAMALDSGSVDGDGAPLVSTATAGTVSDEVVAQVAKLAQETRFDVSAVFEDDPTDAVDTWAAFVDHVEANEAGSTSLGCEALAAVDRDEDGVPDTFPLPEAGANVCFDVIAKSNTTVAPTPEPQLFRATMRVLGDGYAELDSREVYFLVPPVIVGPD